MADNDTTATPLPAPPPEPTPAPAPATKRPAQPKPYTLGTWGEFTNYCCTLCPYATVAGEDVALDHYRKAHLLAAATAPSAVLRTDRFGNPILPTTVKE